MDRNSFIPSMHMMKDLIDECERIEQNETPIYQDNEDDNKNNKKEKFAKNKSNNKKKGHERHKPVADGNGRARARKKVPI